MQMRIHPISTGQVRIRQRMARGVKGPLRRAAMFGGPWSEWLPIHAWAIETDDGVIVVDSGETAQVADAPFAQFKVTPEQEIVPSLRALGIEPDAVKLVAMTHLHGDHMNGLPALAGANVVMSAKEWSAAHTPLAKLTQRVTHQPLPAGLQPQLVTFDGPPIGAFAASHPLSADGRVSLVPAPGHTPGHSAVLVQQDDMHVLIAGDTAYDQQQLLDLVPDAVSPRASVSRDTMRTILRHAGQHPTVYLPSHDPQSAARLAAGEALSPPG